MTITRTRKKLLIFATALIVLLLIAVRAWAVDKMKSVETFVGDSTSAFSTQINKSFSLYIGDNISPVSNPVKSYYVVVTGLYTATGTLGLQLDSDATTLKSFELPDVGTTPTPFEILYKDTVSKINPASGGTYNYTLNVIPSGVTISQFGAKLIVTYRYAPASCDDGDAANEKVKSTEHYVLDSASQLSSATSSQFSIYIGDNITNVTSSMKSVYLVVSGVYTSSASPQLELTLDSNASTTQTFTLVNVGTTPTPFEILYKDTIVIKPTTAGTYTYTLTVTPSNMTISGLGVKIITTYRYKPPGCGTGLPATGELTSIVFDTTVSQGAAYNSALWKGSVGGGTGKVRFQLATSDSDAGPWNYFGSDGVSCGSGFWYSTTGPDAPVEITCAAQNHNNHRYFRYKVQICSSSDCSTAGSISPTVDDVVVSWSP